MNTKLTVKSEDGMNPYFKFVALTILFFICAGLIKIGLITVISWATKYGIKWAGYVPNLSYWEICTLGLACKGLRFMLFKTE